MNKIPVEGMKILPCSFAEKIPYVVSTKVLNQTVKRNAKRFPDGSCFS